MKEFLEQHGYKMWEEDKDEISFSQKYQKRSAEWDIEHYKNLILELDKQP